MLRNPLCAVVMGLCALMVVSEQSYARDLTDAEKQVIADAVKAKLRDPLSATFKWGPVMGEETDAGDGAASVSYCAMVNSKNAYGGYVGDTPFSTFLVIDDETVVVAVVLGMGGTRRETKVAYDFCGQNGYDATYFTSVE